MPVISMKQLLEAGVHFGHQTRKWNPKMAKYIFTSRNDIHIINLEDTSVLIDSAYDYVKQLASEGKTLLFVGTKKQAQKAIEDEAKRCGMFYVNSRWLGGTLTNFKTIRSRVDRLNKLTNMEKLGEFNLLPKKEVLKLKSEMEKLERNLGGIKEMTKLPDALFIVDTKKEHIAVEEARALNIPIVALIDTNCDPEPIFYVIPGNDDAIRAVSLIAGALANAVIEAKEGVAPVFEETPNKDEEAVAEAVVAPILANENNEVVEEKPAKKVEKQVEDKATELVEEKPAKKAKATEKEKPVKKTTAKKAVETK